MSVVMVVVSGMAMDVMVEMVLKFLLEGGGGDDGRMMLVLMLRVMDLMVYRLVSVDREGGVLTGVWVEWESVCNIECITQPCSASGMRSGPSTYPHIHP